MQVVRHYSIIRMRIIPAWLVFVRLVLTQKQLHLFRNSKRNFEFLNLIGLRLRLDLLIGLGKNITLYFVFDFL